MKNQSDTYFKSYSGKKINPLDPQPEEIALEDIAHALSLLCRGNGQTKHFYSVGQHCLNCEREAEARGESLRVRLACLLHDAGEAYLSDVIRPIKKYLPQYYEIEDRFLKAVFVHFGLDDLTDEEWQTVRKIDDDLLVYDLVELLKEDMPESGFCCILKPRLEVEPFEQVERDYKNQVMFLMEEIKKES